MKRCSTCKEYKRSSDFGKRTKRGGLDSQCRACISNRTKKWGRTNPVKRKNNQLLRDYGICIDQFNALFELQKGKCAICEKHQSKFRYSLAVDHDHATGKIRGLLCAGCNSGLARFEDSLSGLSKALNYLKKAEVTAQSKGASDEKVLSNT